MAMLYAVHLRCGQAPFFYVFMFVFICLPCSVMSFYLELELVKSSAWTWFNATSDTVSKVEMD